MYNWSIFSSLPIKKLLGGAFLLLTESIISGLTRLLGNAGIGTAAAILSALTGPGVAAAL